MVDSILDRPERPWTLALKRAMTYMTMMSQVGAIKAPLQS
jgi:hypothetical protein